MKTRGVAKNIKQHSDGGELLGVGVAEDDHVVGEERDAGGSVPRGEPPQCTSRHEMLEEGVEGVDDDGEQHGRNGVALAQTLLVLDQSPRVAIDKHTSGRSREQHADPGTPTPPKAQVRERLEEKGPGHGVEGAGNV